ncbi:hypothetical protein FS749_002123, partial [Ceratobasidium sp. UAMH 11750]
MHATYAVSWKVGGYQKGLLTCLAISPSGAHLVAASEDRNILLVDMNNGKILVDLRLKQCAVLSALWYSESNVLVGCENGCLYDVCFKPTNNNYAVTMCPFLTPIGQQIHSLAFDPTRHLLAVGYGNTVMLFHQQDPDSLYLHSRWKVLELIRGPCNHEGGRVNVLLFQPTEAGCRNLLVGYAEFGWNIWNDVGSVRRICPDLNHNVCTIGRAALTPDGKSIAILTLDHTIVVYALGREGPILASMKEFPYHDSTDYTPIVPVASTSNGLTLGGTTCGEVPMIETGNGAMLLICHEGKTHLIREIA